VIGASSLVAGHERTGMKIQLGRLLDTLPGLIWTVLPDGHIDFVNHAERSSSESNPIVVHPLLAASSDQSRARTLLGEAVGMTTTQVKASHMDGRLKVDRTATIACE
jgi:hypothetical protein